jgi:DNA-binding SARP family transcriptional activator
VSIGGRSVRERDWRKRKARLLFAMLATRQGRDVPRDQVVDHLWPEMDEDRARNNFYVAWSTMKSVLGGASEKGKPSPYVECVGGVCRTVRDTVRSDIDEFEEALFAAREAESDARPKDALSAYECVANLYRGDLLPGDVYDDWFSSRRDHYRAEFVDAMLRASQLLIDAADPGNALMYLRRAIHSDPVREDLYQRALRCQIAVGQRSSAIDTYRQCRGKLSEELGLDPSGETRQLYDQILAMEDRPVAIPFDPLS